MKTADHTRNRTETEKRQVKEMSRCDARHRRYDKKYECYLNATKKNRA